MKGYNQLNHQNQRVSYFCSNLQKMTKKERAKIVMTELEKIYPEVPIPLNHRNAYELLVAVALSAQTTDKK